uniref:Uncharacterized protein n=1 Tax=Cucumis sativus TaxID=3659 RepID=A0A0A0K3Q2_CUCSA
MLTNTNHVGDLCDGSSKPSYCPTANSCHRSPRHSTFSLFSLPQFHRPPTPRPCIWFDPHPDPIGSGSALVILEVAGSNCIVTGQICICQITWSQVCLHLVTYSYILLLLLHCFNDFELPVHELCIVATTYER